MMYNSINYLSALLTPLIAILGLYIAFQQWKTAERKQKQELFELRYQNLFQPLCNIMQKIFDLKNNKINPLCASPILNEEYKQFLLHYSKYRFLVGKDDASYILINLKKMIKYGNDNCLTIGQTNPEEFDKNIVYYASYIKDVLNKYLCIENNNFYNIYSFASYILKITCKIFLPRKIQIKIHQKILEREIEKDIDDLAMIKLI